ncbi:hypothetical protein [Sessilibacter corallicola]|uniref:hypothetical protein n=1 Tax=Sessilibacter corallicola TaxID=2904075 RepID=UPI001E6110DA|nr:hypothetical protein [Sessilibacter corallicola]MCE2029241.1 hypothetical protein [Sessilibacter corallicola]
MSLITTKLDVSTVIVDGYAKSKIDGIPTELSPSESIELIRVESDKRFGFVDDLAFKLFNKRFSDDVPYLDLLRSSIAPKDDSANDYDYASRQYIESHIEIVESCLSHLNSSLQNIDFDLDDTVLPASKLGWDFYRYVTAGSGIFSSPERIEQKIDCLANLFEVSLSEDKLHQFILVLISALKTNIMTASHRGRKDEYQVLIEDYLDNFDPDICYFDDRLCDGVMFAIRPNDNWIIFDPEISKLQKQQ